MSKFAKHVESSVNHLEVQAETAFKKLQKRCYLAKCMFCCCAMTCHPCFPYEIHEANAELSLVFTTPNGGQDRRSRPTRKRVILLRYPYSHYVLKGVLLCEVPAAADGNV